MTGAESASPGKKLVHVATVPLSLYCFLDGQVRHMREQGYEVHGVASAGPLLQRFAEREGCAVHAVEMPRAISPLQDLRAVWQLYALFREVRPDLVHCHTPKGGLLGTIAAFLARVPVRVYQVHGLPHVTASGLKRKLLCCTERISCLLASRVYCVSASLRDLVLEEGFCGAGKVSVLHNGSINGVDAAHRYNPDRHDGSALRVLLKIPEGAPVLGFVGRMVRDKGMLELLESWRELRERYSDLHFLVVGPFEEKDALPAAAKEELLRDERVRVVGQVDDSAPYYAAMDLLAFPSHREGFGLVNIEASAMGLPVVSTRITGCVDSVRDGSTGVLVPPGDSAALTAALADFLDHPGKRALYGREGRQWVLERFQPRQIWAALGAEYRRLLEARGRAGRSEAFEDAKYEATF